MTAAPPPTLTRRQLGRALLARQHLLARTDLPVPTLTDHLVGLQAQEPLDPYTGLWSRLEGFVPDDLGARVTDRSMVRVVTWRGTVHLHTADGAVWARALAEQVMAARVSPGNMFGRATAGLDLDAVLADCRAWFAEEPRNGTELKARLVHQPTSDLDRLIDVVKYALPLAQVPPRGVWGQSKRATWSPLDVFLRRPLAVATPDDEDDAIVRYLTAFGPASVADIATWSGWRGVKAKVDRVRDRLVAYRHEETGRELLDVPDGLFVDADAPAPPRFLPEFDNVGLSHADRSRIVPADLMAHPLFEPDPRPRGVLVDGLVAGLWSLRRDEGRTVLVLKPAVRWTRAQTRDVEAEGAALLGLHAPTDDHDVEVVALP
jgi:hypothetical protein